MPVTCDAPASTAAAGVTAAPVLDATETSQLATPLASAAGATLDVVAAGGGAVDYTHDSAPMDGIDEHVAGPLSGTGSLVDGPHPGTLVREASFFVPGGEQ